MFDIASIIFNQPHLVQADRLDALAAFVLSREGFDVQLPQQPEPQAYAPSESAQWAEGGYYIEDGVAIIDMIGTMAHRAGGIQAMSGIESYARLSRRFKHAMNNGGVNAILLNGDTPGGAVNGAFDFADIVYAARGVKPVYTLAADRLASAGYLIGSAAEEVHTTQTGIVGSIGVVMKHLDISKWNTKTGINSTYIFAGDRKVDGNPDQPLSKDVLARFNDEVQMLYGMFVDAVERNRSMSRDEIIDTQAAVYTGQQAVDVGLADSVTTIDALLEKIKTKHRAGRPLFSSTTQMEANAMSEKQEKPTTSAEEQGGAAQAATGAESAAAGNVGAGSGDAAAEGAEISAAVEAGGVDETAKAIRTEERQRFEAIMTNDNAKGREAAAVKLACRSDMSADDVIATLADMPKSATGKSALDAAMEQAGSPGIGAEGEGGEMSASATILADYNSARGKKRA